MLLWDAIAEEGPVHSFARAAKGRQKRSMRLVVLEVVGLRAGRHEKLWIIWFMFALIVGLVANFVVLLGCLSSPTQPIYLFRVSSQDLIDATANVTDVKVEDLSVGGLPTHWCWSLSGVCAVYPMYPDDAAAQQQVSCSRSFPPKLTIHDMLTFGIESSSRTTNNTTTTEADVENILKPWTKALTSLESALPPPSRLPTLIKAAAALSLLSTVSSFSLLIAAVLSLTLLRNKIRRWMLYIFAFLDAGMFLGAGVLLIYAMNGGPRSIIQLSDVGRGGEWTYIGPGFFVLFAGVVFKLVSIGAFFCVIFIVFIMIAFAVLACMSEACSGERPKDEAVAVVYTENPQPVYVDEDRKRYS